jgi:lipopolysaccharide biosynthesis glycosyltransferase
MPVATYYKLSIPELLPPSVRKAIWLDCDLVVATDLAPLWDTGLEGRHALAVQDQAVPFVSSLNGVACHQQLGIASDAPYFNAGVMVVDLDLWRRDEIPRRVVEYLRQHRHTVVFWDQEGLNAILANRWGVLDPRWNYNPYARDARLRPRHPAGGASPSLNNPWIIHFTGNLKPWTYPRRDFAHDMYFRYLDRTAWAGWRPKRSLRGMMVEMYEGSGLRDALYPGEEWIIRLLRAFTRRYASEATR